jgi:hypothetical protein
VTRLATACPWRSICWKTVQCRSVGFTIRVHVSKNRRRFRFGGSLARTSLAAGSGARLWRRRVRRPRPTAP